MLIDLNMLDELHVALTKVRDAIQTDTTNKEYDRNPRLSIRMEQLFKEVCLTRADVIAIESYLSERERHKDGN